MVDSHADHNNMELVEHTAGPSAEATADLSPATTPTAIAPASPVVAAPSSLFGSVREHASSLVHRGLEYRPSDPLDSVAQVTKVVSAVVKPVPWLGPAVELVESIVRLCENVGKNRRAATELGKHCMTMLDAVKEALPTVKDDVVYAMGSDLEILLVKIDGKLKKWNNMHFLKSLAKQAKISDGIKSFDAEIRQFCARYSLVAQTKMLAWIELLEQEREADKQELKDFISDAQNATMLELMCQGQQIAGLQDTLTTVLHIMQDLLFRSDTPAHHRKALENNISAICRASGEVPPDIELTEGMICRPRDPIGGSGAFDIYRGFCFGDQRRVCAIKIYRSLAYDEAAKIRFKRQLEHWRKVSVEDKGEHILPLVGAILRVRPDPLLCFVSPWMEKGNALQYVKLYDENINRINLIKRIAEGLKILHTNHLLHGYLKASNILIDDFGNPLLADFGLLRVIEKEHIAINSYPRAGEACRWLPPEMLVDGLVPLSLKCDVYMFAMTVIELMTHEKPFAHIKRDPQVMIDLWAGRRPERPEGEFGRKVVERGLSDQLWNLLVRCWSKEPDDRPSICEVLAEIESLPPPS